MKVKELNALLNKLAKPQQDQPIMVAIGPLVWENPTLFQGKDGYYIVPKEIEDQLEQHFTRTEIAEKMAAFHAQANNQGGATEA